MAIEDFPKLFRSIARYFKGATNPNPNLTRHTSKETQINKLKLLCPITPRDLTSNVRSWADERYLVASGYLFFSSFFKNKGYPPGIPEVLLTNHGVSETINKKGVKTVILEYTASKGLKVELNIEGFNKDSITVNVDGPWLVVKGTLEHVHGDENGGFHVHTFYRSYEIPPNSDVANIKKNFSNNVLKIVVPPLTPNVNNLNVRKIKNKTIQELSSDVIKIAARAFSYRL